MQKTWSHVKKIDQHLYHWNGWYHPGWQTPIPAPSSTAVAPLWEDWELQLEPKIALTPLRAPALESLLQRSKKSCTTSPQDPLCCCCRCTSPCSACPLCQPCGTTALPLRFPPFTSLPLPKPELMAGFWSFWSMFTASWDSEMEVGCISSSTSTPGRTFLPSQSHSQDGGSLPVNHSPQQRCLCPQFLCHPSLFPLDMRSWRHVH